MNKNLFYILGLVIIVITINLVNILIAPKQISQTDINMKQKEDKFSYNVQLAGYEYERVDQKGEINYEKFVAEFDAFPWIEQMEEAGKYKNKSEPTLSVVDHLNQKDLWVSIASSDLDQSNFYLIGYNHPKTIRGFLGFGKPRTVKWVEIYATEEKKIVKECFYLFFNRQYEQLENKLRQLHKFDEMEAYIQG